MDLTTLLPPWLIWFLAGIDLAFLELFLPGFIILFFGMGCVVVAGALLAWDLSLAQQVLLFIVSSVAALLLLRKWLQRVFLGVSADRQTAAFDDFPGGQFVPVVKTITPVEHGRIQYRGTTWYAAADETIEAGLTVEILRFADQSRQVFFVRKTHPS